MINSIYLNIPVADVAKSKAFFGNLGFSFYDKFTNEQSACVIIGDEKFAMLNLKSNFSRFLDKPLADPSTNELIISLGCESAETVSRISEAAFAQGARKINEPEDNEFMFSWGFEDLDGHIWDLFWFKS